MAGGGSVTVTWPEATNDGGPSMAALGQSFTEPAGGFWGYRVYREDPAATAYGLVGSVPENTSGAGPYTFTDTGVTPGNSPTADAAFPTSNNPGILAGSWYSATEIEQEINLNIEFAKAHGLTNIEYGTVVTGEHSGLENPNMPAALAASGITTFAADASRQPDQYQLSSGGSTAESAPRYPSNIYYDASTWAEELGQYDAIYGKGQPRRRYSHRRRG